MKPIALLPDREEYTLPLMQCRRRVVHELKIKSKCRSKLTNIRETCELAEPITFLDSDRRKLEKHFGSGAPPPAA